MPSTIDDARQLIQSRLAEIEAEASQLRQAIASLGGGDGDQPRRRRRARPAKPAAADVAPAPRKRRTSRRGRSARAPRGQRRAQLLTAIKEQPGARPSELAKKMGVTPSQVHGLIRKARAEKLVVKKGSGYALKG